jgi:hypothetical protein
VVERMSLYQVECRPDENAVGGVCNVHIKRQDDSVLFVGTWLVSVGVLLVRFAVVCFECCNLVSTTVVGV